MPIKVSAAASNISFRWSNMGAGFGTGSAVLVSVFTNAATFPLLKVTKVTAEGRALQAKPAGVWRAAELSR